MSNNDVLIPKMRRRERKFRFPLLGLLFVFTGIIILISSTFIGINLKHYIYPISAFYSKNLSIDDYIYSIYYIPQIPALMFICSAFGKKISVCAVILYILLGLFFIPVFGLGGGINYVLNYSFGYILSYIVVSAICSNILARKYSFKNMFIVSILGVLFIHFSGILYMSLITLLKQDGLKFITGWIEVQSGIKIIYDMIFSFIFVLIGKFINEIIRFIN